MSDGSWAHWATSLHASKCSRFDEKLSQKINSNNNGKKIEIEKDTDVNPWLPHKSAHMCMNTHMSESSQAHTRTQTLKTGRNI